MPPVVEENGRTREAESLRSLAVGMSPADALRLVEATKHRRIEAERAARLARRDQHGACILARMLGCSTPMIARVSGYHVSRLRKLLRGVEPIR